MAPSGIFIPLLVLFTQISNINGIESTIRGESLLIENNEVYISLSEPINQLMFISSDSTLIYYPDDNRAFILKKTKSDAVMDEFLQLEPLSPNYYSQLGFQKIVEKTIKDTLLYQFLSNNKKTPTLITQKVVNAKTVQIIIATNIAASNYTKIDFNEYSVFNGMDYIKKYTVTTYDSNVPINTTEYLIENLREAEETDFERLKFTIPTNVDIERKSFN